MPLIRAGKRLRLEYMGYRIFQNRQEKPRRNTIRRANFALMVFFCFFLLSLGTTRDVRGQSVFPSESGAEFADKLFGNNQGLFANDGRINLLMVALNPFGLTESAAEQIGLILQKNLSNSGHFSVVGPREVNAVFENKNPDLVDCREIACGVESGKMVGAELVLVGTIRIVRQLFILRIRIIDTINNTTDYEEEIRFSDSSMDEDLFRLSNNISRNSVLTGRVLSTSIRGIVVGLGKRHGIKIGDSMVIYKIEVPIKNLEGEQIDTQKKKIAIVKVLNVNENSSETILSHSSEPPQVSFYAQTYLDRMRQIELVENTRRELDTGLRLENKIRPLEMAPVLLADSERKKWQNQMNMMEWENKMWLMASIGGGIATVIFFRDYQQSSNSRLRVMGAIGGASFGIWKFLKTREELNDLKLEGRSKGYLGNYDIDFNLSPGNMELGIAYRF